MTLTDVSCLIPLYRSSPLLDLVFGNIDEHVAQGAVVLCSDQHGLDEAADRIVERYRDEPLVTVLRSTAGGNWVSNVNALISHASTDFFRIIPHDDSVEAASTGWLAETLRSRPDAVLCHGHVRAEHVDGRRLPDRDEPNLPLRPREGREQFSMGLFWQGLFNGAFKALVRRQCLPSGPLLVRPTLDLVHAERAWLFGLSLIGEFLFDDRATMRKRYWTGSLTAGWTPDASHVMSTAHTMASYANDLVTDPGLRRRLRFNAYFNALERSNWLDGFVVSPPEFDGLTPTDGLRVGLPT